MAGVPLAPRCLRYEYVCGAGVVRGYVPAVLVLLFVVDFCVSHARADGCLTGGEREICRAFFVLAPVCICVSA